MRTEARLRQVDLAMRLDRPQSFVAKYESGERRLDFIEFIEIAEAIGFDPIGFLHDFLAREDDTRARSVGGG